MMNPKTVFRLIVCSMACMVMVCMLSGCDKTGTQYYKLGSTQLYNDNDTGLYPIDAPSDTIPAKAYAIRVAFTATVSAATNAAKDENTLTASNLPATVNIYSLTSFDANHPALSSLNDLFFCESNLWNEATVSPLTPANIYPGIGILNFTSTPPAGDTSITSSFLILIAPPATLGTRSFVLNIVYADSSKVSDTITTYLY